MGGVRLVTQGTWLGGQKRFGSGTEEPGEQSTWSSSLETKQQEGPTSSPHSRPARSGVLGAVPGFSVGQEK